MHKSIDRAIYMDDMTNQIGFLTGDILNMLNDCGEASVLTIKTRLNISNTMVFLALGWLSREGKIYIRKEGDSFLVRTESNGYS